MDKDFGTFVFGFVTGTVVGSLLYMMIFQKSEYEWRDYLKEKDAEYSCERGYDYNKRGVWVSDKKGKYHCVKEIP